MLVWPSDDNLIHFNCMSFLFTEMKRYGRSEKERANFHVTILNHADKFIEETRKCVICPNDEKTAANRFCLLANIGPHESCASYLQVKAISLARESGKFSLGCFDKTHFVQGLTSTASAPSNSSVTKNLRTDCATICHLEKCNTGSPLKSGCNSAAKCAAMASLDSMDVKLYELLP